MAQKRSHDEFAADVASKDDLAVKLSSTTDSRDKHDESEWQVVDTKAKKRKKLPRKEGDRYPSITHSPHARLQSLLGLGVLQNLVLYLLADGPGPQWCSIKNHANFRKVVVLMIPGLEMGMFDGGIDLTATAKALATELVEQKTDTALKQKGYTLPDDYYPKQLDKLDLPASLAPLQDIFDHVWPVKTAGDDRHGKMHSPLSSILTVPVKNDKDDKQNKKGPGPPAAAKHWQNQTTHITTLIATTQELLEAGYVLHPAHFAGDDEAMKGYEQHRLRRHVTQADGWKDSRGTITLDDGPKDTLQPADAVLAVDCEMCITSPPDVEPVVYSLTRVSVIDWDGHVVFDELVKPKDPITNYVTAYSGITAEMLQDVTTTLEDVQEKLLAKLSSQTILVGHSLDSDLNALKITHPFIVDTALLYPHPRGPPLRSSLKWLAQKYLNRSIQAGHGSAGHNSIEDALATLDLVIQKCQKGKAWGTSDASTESIFHRLGRALRPKRFKNQPDGEDEPRTGAVVDWGDPRRGFGSQAKTIVACQNDADVVKGVAAAVNGGAIDSQIPTEGVDFTWARFKELEAYRQWWRNTKSHDMTELRGLAISKNADKTLQDVVAETVANIGEIWQSLPPCTAFIVYSGSGDPRRLYELQEQKQQHKAEYATRKWDELTVHWTDKDEQELKRACDIARRGIAFIGVK